MQGGSKNLDDCATPVEGAHDVPPLVLQKHFEGNAEHLSPKHLRPKHILRSKNNYFTEMCSSSEAGSYLRLIDFCVFTLLSPAFWSRGWGEGQVGAHDIPPLVLEKHFEGNGEHLPPKRLAPNHGVTPTRWTTALSQKINLPRKS